MTSLRLLVFAFVFFVSFVANSLHAHPVPRRAHDRTITVRLTTEAKTGQVKVVVNYRLEVDEFTVVWIDLPPLSDRVDLSQLRKPQEFYQAFTNGYAPILAANLVATFDGRPLEFKCQKQGYRLRDEDGTPLGHLRCDYRFEALEESAEHAKPGSQHRLTFKEGNYELEEGRIQLSLIAEAPIELVSKVEPDAALKARPAAELQPGDDARLRNTSATFTLAREKPQSAGDSAPPDSDKPTQEARTEHDSSAPGHSLLALVLDSQQGFWALLLLAAAFGAAHALTPGHGKTLVAAYLVGERGTVGHAFVLGLVTTLTHTGAVLVLAALLPLFGGVMMALGLAAGLLVTGMGFWLFLRRLSSGADHVHLGGHHHDHHHHHCHHHGPVDHCHDEHGHAHALPASTAGLGWWGLVVLGMSGGIVPCTDAIIMLGFAISAQRLWLGLPLLLAFSAGLASVLIAIGIAVVYMKGFASSRWGESRFFRALPVISAALVTVMGLWLCYASVHPT